MAKPTKWTTAGDGVSQTRKSNKGNTIHRQVTPSGTREHINRKDGSSILAPAPTIDPRNPK